MSILSTILITITALECLYIMYLETFATQSDSTSRVFNMSKEELSRASVTNLFKNQGIYNGLLGVAMLYAAFLATAKTELSIVLLVYIILAAIYGALTADKAILLKQGSLPIIALISILLF